MRLSRLLFLILLTVLCCGGRALLGQNTVTCSSDDGGRHYCSADTSNGVRLSRQRSGSPCIQGRTWGSDQRGIWVDKGCRADFILNVRGNGNGYYPGNGNNNGYPGNNNGYRPGNGNNNGYYPGNGNNNGYYPGNGGGQSLTCSSDDGKRHYCSADTRRGVTLVRQRSGSACVQGRSWGYDRRGVWVDRGCRADFQVR